MVMEGLPIGLGEGTRCQINQSRTVTAMHRRPRGLLVAVHGPDQAKEPDRSQGAAAALRLVELDDMIQDHPPKLGQPVPGLFLMCFDKSSIR